MIFEKQNDKNQNTISECKQRWEMKVRYGEEVGGIGNKHLYYCILKIINIPDNRMRGIQINNYFNNHITLNGKKVNQDSQPLTQTTRQKLTHPHPEPIQPHTLAEARPSPGKLAPTPIKKRTNTLVELKKHLPVKRSISVERHHNATSAKKKEEMISDSEEKEEEPLINMSQRKLRPHPTKGGLGKRSKSTIIKTHQPQKEPTKKDSKKLNSNPTSESAKQVKPRRKKSGKVSETARDKANSTIKQPATRKEQPLSRQIFKKEKLVIKLDKHLGKSDKPEKKSARNTSKNTAAPAKVSKPISAREKKVKKDRFIEQLKEKYENQTILQDQLSKLSSSRFKDPENAMDVQFLSVMSSLEKILTSVGSKQKLKKELQIINEKLREFKLQTEEEQEEVGEQAQALRRQTHREQLLVSNGKSKEEIVITLENDLRQEYEQDEQVDDQSEQEDEEPLPRRLSEEQDEMLMRLEGEEVKNPLIGKRNHNIFFIEETPQEQSDDRRRQIELLKKFKGQSTRMMEKVGLASSTQQKQETQAQQPSQPPKLTIQNVSGLSSNSSSSHKWQDKYPIGVVRSPKFDQAQLLGAIELKQQFLSSKHDKMSELVRRMFEKQLVSPRSYEFQIKSLDRRHQQEHQQIEAMRRQAEQLSSMLSEIKKDKEEIQGIDELIRHEKWEEAQRLVQQHPQQETLQAQQQPSSNEEQNDRKGQPKRDSQIEKIDEEKQEKEEAEDIHQWQHSPPQRSSQVSTWEREGGWQRVKINSRQVEDNEFVQPPEIKRERGELTNRGRKGLPDVDIDQECGGTEESEELQPHEVRPDEEEECIYYQEDDEHDKKETDKGLIQLVQIPDEENSGVFHIRDEDEVQRSGLKVPSSSQSQSERGGFTSNLYFIKEYCIAICEFVRDNDTFKAQFRLNVSKPLNYDLPALLALYRQPDDPNYPFTRRSHRPAIPQLIWEEFNSQYQTLKLHSSQASRESEKYRLEKELELTFVRMIYDVLNESLDHERPGGQFGRALPWRQTAKHLKNLKQLGGEGENVEAYDLMFGVAIARIIQWGSCLCGFLPDTVQLQNTEIDEAYVNHIRETRTAFLLEKMMAEEEPMMTNFELQETEVQYWLGQLIYQSLMEEAEAELALIF